MVPVVSCYALTEVLLRSLHPRLLSRLNGARLLRQRRRGEDAVHVTQVPDPLGARPVGNRPNAGAVT
eukprot:6979627-Alexandrium_andersonii.AAC.1